MIRKVSFESQERRMDQVLAAKCMEKTKANMSITRR